MRPTILQTGDTSGYYAGLAACTLSMEQLLDYHILLVRGALCHYRCLIDGGLRHSFVVVAWSKHVVKIFHGSL